MALRRQTVHIPLAAGLNTKADPRAMEPPQLAVCKDAQFDEVGGIQTRKPFTRILNNTANTMTGIRKLAVYENELLAFTQTGLWSWSADSGAWVNTGATYLAPKISEESVFVAPPDQYDADRAELSGITMYCWTEDKDSSTTTTYVAALDSTTGAVVLPPEEVQASAVWAKLTVLDTTILLTWKVSTTYYARSYDPNDLANPSSDINTGAVTTGVDYAIAADPSQTDEAVIAIARGTSYTIKRISATPAFSATADHAYGAVKIAVDVATDGQIIVARQATGATTRKGDVLTTGLAAGTMDTSVMTSLSTSVVGSIGCKFKTTQDSSEYRCYVWDCSAVNTGVTEYLTTTNYIDTGANVGTQVTACRRLALASQPFLYNGQTYAWATFITPSTVVDSDSVGFKVALQNTHFLYRDDGVLVAKATATTAQRHDSDSAAFSYLATVQNTSGNIFKTALTEKRIIPLGNSHDGYAAESIRVVTVELDSNEARRTVQLGNTLYITGGQICQYDGTDLVELGFHIYPYYFNAAMTGSAGSFAAGDYAYKGSWRDDNAKGELDRSTTATYDVVTQDGTKTGQYLQGFLYLHPTLRTGRRAPAVEIWRTAVNPGPEAPFYLVTSKDPTSATYVLNNETGTSFNYTDTTPDATLVKNEANPENSGTLERLPAPSATIIVASQDRIFLAGIAGQPHRVVYSLLRNPGEVCAFHDALYIDLPAETGAITGLGFLNETLIAFTTYGVYALSGDGYDNNGGGQNYGPARLLSADVGAVGPDSIALTPRGILFLSAKGWYLLDLGWQVSYIGGAVSDFDSDTFLAVHLIKDQHQVRCVSSSRILVWDYLVNQWSEWTIDDALSSVMYGAVQHYAVDTVDGNDDEILKQADWSTQPGLPPKTWGNGANSSGGSMAIDGTDSYGDSVATAWVQDGQAWIDRDGTNEETTGYTSITASLLGTTLTNNQSDGATVERTWMTLLSGSHAAGVTQLTVDKTEALYSVPVLSLLPTSGYLTLSEGLAAEETVAYTSTDPEAGTIAVGALANTHADNATVRLVWPEEYGLDIETGWIKVAGLQGYQRVRHILILGEYRGPCSIRIRVAKDYNESDSGVTWTDDKTWTVSPVSSIGGPLQVRHGLSDQKCEAVKIRITVLHTDGSSRPIGEAIKLTGLALEIGVKSDVYKGLPAAQKQ